MEENNNKTIKILVGVIIGLSTIILFSGILYIFNMQNKIEKLETEQEEQLRRQVETQNMASIQSIQTEPNTQTQQTAMNITNKNKNNSQTSSMKGAVYITKSTSGPVNVREKATMNSKIIARLPDDISLKFISRNGSWYYVSYNVNGYSEYGYINKSQLASSNSKRNENIQKKETKNERPELVEKCKKYRIYSNYSDYEIKRDLEFKYGLYNSRLFENFEDGELYKMNALQESTNAKLKVSDEMLNVKICKSLKLI